MDPRESVTAESSLPTGSTPPAEILDLTPKAQAARRDQFHLRDRVKRHAGDSESSQWGTITGRVDDEERDDWLVLDNAGITHCDHAGDLSIAVRWDGKIVPRFE